MEDMNKKRLRMIFTLGDLTEDLLHKSLVNIPKYLKMTNYDKLFIEVAYLNEKKY